MEGRGGVCGGPTHINTKSRTNSKSRAGEQLDKRKKEGSACKTYLPARLSTGSEYGEAVQGAELACQFESLWTAEIATMCCVDEEQMGKEKHQG